MSIKTLFLILILHIFHEEEGYQASAELPNFSRFIFYFWEKKASFKKKNDPFIHSQLYATTLQHLFQAKENVFWINMGYLLHKFLLSI